MIPLLSMCQEPTDRYAGGSALNSHGSASDESPPADVTDDDPGVSRNTTFPWPTCHPSADCKVDPVRVLGDRASNAPRPPRSTPHDRSECLDRTDRPALWRRESRPWGLC